MDRKCRFCGIQLNTVPPTEAITRHIVGLCAPSRNEVDAALEAMEPQPESEKEALRRFYERESGYALLRKARRWLKDRWLWMRNFSWQ